MLSIIKKKNILGEKCGCWPQVTIMRCYYHHASALITDYVLKTVLNGSDGPPPSTLMQHLRDISDFRIQR